VIISSAAAIAGRFADDCKTSGLIQPPAEARREDRMIVGDHYFVC